MCLKGPSTETRKKTIVAGPRVNERGSHGSGRAGSALREAEGMIRNLLSMFRDIVDLIHANPASAGMIAAVLVTVLGNYGLHVSVANLTGFLIASNVILFGWVHSQVTPVANLPKSE